MAGIDLVKDKHHKMITTLSDHIGGSIDSEEFKQLKNRFKAVLSPLEIKNATNIMEISEALEKRGYIEPGKYDYLKEVLKSFNVRLVKDIIEPVEEDIKKMKSTKESQLRSDTGNELENTSDLEKPRYDIEPNQKGFMLIINFKKDREGSENDVKTVKDFFEDTLKFRVEVEQDLTLDNLKTELKGAKEQISGELRKKYYCFILVIMGHGNEDGIKTDDKKLITIKEIIDIYRNKEMPGFLGKPKMVFVQSCRGPSTMEIVESDFKISELAIQQDADMLIAYSTTEDYVSFRSTQTGAHFIQELIAVIKDYYKESHLEEMLVIVRHRFATKQKNQMPCTWSTLTKLFYLKNM